MGGRLKFFGSGLFASVATFGLVFCFANLFSLLKSSENDNQKGEIVSRARRDVAKNDEDARIKFPELFDGTYSYNTWSPNWSKTTPTYEIRSNSSATPSIWKDEFDPVKDEGSSFSSSSVSEYATEEILRDSWRDLCKDTHGQSCSTFKLSPNEQFIVGQITGKKLWRRSSQKFFTVNSIKPATKQSAPDTFINSFFKDKYCLYAGWAPNIAGEQALAFVCDFNVYVIFPGKSTDGEKIRQLTENGDEFKMLNGVTDWANEEENIKADNTIYWAPDGTKLLFASYDVSSVTVLRYSDFDTKNGYQEFSKAEDAYPKIREIPYAKAGGNYATVKLTIVDDVSKAGLTTPNLDLPDEGKDMAHLSRTSWSPNSDWFVMSWINRDTTTRRTFACQNSNPWSCKQVDSESSTDHWVGFKGPFYPLATENYGEYFTILSRPDGDDSYWRVVSVKNGAISDWPVTGAGNENKYVVSDISVNKIMEVGGEQLPLYTYAAPLPSQRHLYMSPNGKDVCVTCGLMQLPHPAGDDKNSCDWVDTRFQKRSDTEYIIIASCRGPGVPVTYYSIVNVAGITRPEMDGFMTNLKWELYFDNNELQSVKNEKQDGWYKRESGNFASPYYPEKPLHYELYLPPNFDETAVGKYALLVFVYGAPEYQNVDQRWTTDFVKAYLPSSYDVVTAVIDGRGSAYEGDKFMHLLYKKLGQLEPIDQVQTAQHILKTHPAINPARTAIYGWSYGGYATSHVLGYDAGNTFKCGVAVAPLADWRYYDTIYAERYMGQDITTDAYKRASIVEAHPRENYANVDYTIIHGTDDDNVHFLNAVAQQKSLVRAGIDFKAEFYADEDHSIRSTSKIQQHVYRKILKNILDCFGYEWRN